MALVLVAQKRGANMRNSSYKTQQEITRPDRFLPMRAKRKQGTKAARPSDAVASDATAEGLGRLAPPTPARDAFGDKATGDALGKTAPRTTSSHKRKLRYPDVHVMFGEVLRRYRKEADLSQAELGNDADIDRAYLSRIERAEQSPTLATILAIAKQLNAPAWQILKDAEEGAAERARRLGKRP